MDVPQGLPVALLAAAWTLGLAVVGAAAWHAPWSRLREDEQSHVFLGAIVAVALLWTITARVGPLVQFHLLGATLLYLLFGLPLALVGIAAVAAAATAAGAHDWMALGARFLVAGALPIAISHAVLRVAEARLPPNFFVYIFAAAFFGAAAAMAANCLSASLLGLGTATPPSLDDMRGPMTLMLAFGEATLTGMLVTLFVVYKPAWVGTFRDERYLRRRGP
jgi:uncharacterized membrane protein